MEKLTFLYRKVILSPLKIVVGVTNTLKTYNQELILRQLCTVDYSIGTPITKDTREISKKFFLGLNLKRCIYFHPNLKK